MKGSPVIGMHLREELASRGISEEIAERFSLSTVNFSDGEAVADPKSATFAFPFARQGKEIGVHIRAPGKQFFWTKNSQMALWNEDVLRDEELGDRPLIITEGIWDALTAIDAGFPFAVSMPNGAPPATSDSDELPPLDLEAEKNGRFKCLYEARDALKRVKRFIIAVDSDAPGQRLARELVRRLSAARCSFVSYPDDCKDLSDVRQWYGQARVVEILNAAKPYPLRGLYRLSEYPASGKIEAFPVGWPTLDNHFKIIPGEFFVVTGIPGHGKSSIMLNMIVNLGLLYDWRSAIFTPENPAPTYRNRLRSLHSGWAIDQLRKPELAATDKWLDEHILFIDGEPGRRDGGEEADFDVDWLLERAGEAVLRDGIKVLLLDPWNEIEHARTKNESTPEYISRSIRQIRRFSRDYGVATGVVAHPTKDVAEKGKSRAISLYDIDGAAHWFNKCDHGIVIDLPDRALGHVNFRVAKSRFAEDAGEPGQVTLKFNRHNYRYTMLEPEPEPAQPAFFEEDRR